VARRWLITGSCGQFGGHVLAALPTGDEVVATGYRTCAPRGGRVLDVTDQHGMSALLERERPTHVVHLAALSTPSKAAAQPGVARLVNRDIVALLAEYAAQAGAWLCYPSSDFVFNGAGRRRYRESDQVDPLSDYARTKVAGEREVLRRNAGAVVRLSLMLGAPVCLRDTWWVRAMGMMQRGEPVPAVVDEFRTPMSLADGAAALVGLGVRRYVGVMHVGGPEILTPMAILSSLGAAARLRTELVPVRRVDLDGPDRPRWVPLDTAVLRARAPELVPSTPRWADLAAALTARTMGATKVLCQTSV
jgi:dTDP-4-dehydrorhamnose reductase